MLNKIIMILVLVVVVVGVFYMMSDSDGTEKTSNDQKYGSGVADTGSQDVENEIVADEDDIDLGEVYS